MNGRSFWQKLKTRWLTGSLALTLGLVAPAAAQYPDTLPPIPNTLRVRPASTIQAQPTALQKGEQPAEQPKSETPIPQAAPESVAMPEVLSSSCASCGNRGGGGCSSCGNGSGIMAPGCGCLSYPCGYHGCFPGHRNCCSDCCHDAGPVGRFFCCFYKCLCCPDPCYEPCYRVEANSAFWVDGARPVTMTRIRWDAGRNFSQPDRNEFFWARTGGRGPANRESNLAWDSLTLYQEVATAKASFFIEQEYRTVDPDSRGGPPPINPHASGFGDLNLGTKALLFDCELLQVAFQFRTYIPTGSAGKGLGTGHVSLEPSLLATVKLMPETYLQLQVSEWIPIGGDPNSAGSILHHHYSLNHVLWRIMPDVPLIGTLEAVGYSFQDGEYTDFALAQPRLSSGDTWWSAGPGLRLAICNRIDFGVSALFGLTQGNPEQIYRSEFRFRF